MGMARIPVNRRKFYPPSSPRWYQRRPALCDRLEAGRSPECRLTLLTGGPGWGKSLLAAEYLETARTSGLAVLWYGLSEGDRDLAVFLTHLNVGFQGAIPGFEGVPSELLAAQAAGSGTQDGAWEGILGAIAEELEERAPEGVLLVLDDLQQVAEYPRVLQAVETLIPYFPASGQLLLVSRTRPPLRLAQYAVKNQLLELGPSELALGLGEVQGLLEAVGKDGDELAARILHDTDGWAVGVLAAAQGGDLRGDDPIHAYLSQEIFEALPEPLQSFLLTCAFFPRLDPELYHEITGQQDFGERLGEAEQKGLFLVKRTGTGLLAEEPWYYQFAPMFRDFLRERARSQWPAARLSELSRKLAYVVESEQPEQAVAYSLAAGDVKRAEQLLRRLAEELLNTQRPEALKRLLSLFGEERLARSAWLQLFEGELARQGKDFDRALACYARAEQLAEAEGDPQAKGRSLAYQAAVRAARGEREVYELVQQAKDLIPPEDLAGRALAHNTLGVYHLSCNEVGPAEIHLEEALRLYRQAGDEAGLARVSHNLGLAHTKEGRFEAALASYREAIAHSQAAGALAMPVTYHNMAVVHLQSGDLEAAMLAAEAAFELARRLGSRWDMAYATLTLGRINGARGDFRRSAGQLEEAHSRGMQGDDRLFEANALLALAELARRQGKPAKARQLVEEAIALRQLSVDDPGMIETAIELAKVRLDAGEISQALSLLRSCEAYLARHGHRFRLCEVTLLLARAWQAHGEVDQAELAQARGAAIAREHGYGSLLLPQFWKAHPEGAAPEATELRFTCFGRFAVRSQGESLDQKRWSGQKTKLLLVYLLLNRRGVTREQLVELFYSDADPSTGALNVLVTRLRRALEPDLERNASSRYVLFQEGRYQFNFAAHYWADIEEFVYLTDLAQDPQLPPDERYALLTRAVALYEGPFMAEFHDPWCMLEREGYRRRLNAAYERLYGHCLRANDALQLLALAERHIRVDRCSELAHQAKMRALAMQGKRDEALRHFKLADQIFQREFGMGASEEIVALFKRIQRGDPLAARNQ